MNRNGMNRNLIGQTFGKLTVISYEGKFEGRDFWFCECSCGEGTKIENTASLENRKNISCGCARDESRKRNIKEKNRKKYIGKIIGKLKILDIIESEYVKDDRFLCDCKSCGRENFSISMRSVLEGRSSTCGCGSKETQFQKKYNEYDLSNEYGIGFTLKGKEFYFDLEDYDLIKDYCWGLHEGYVTTNTKYNKEIKLHVLVFGKYRTGKNVIDHKNGNKADNRKSNLRIATRSQNGMNNVRSPNTTSGIQGVVFDKEKNKYRARITVEGEVIHLGYFTELKDAVTVRKNAQVEYFGEFNPDLR